MTSQFVRRSSSRQRLIDAASVLAADVGFAAVSVQEIGDAAGMSRGAVNYRFGSKAALFDAILEQQIEDWSDLARTLPRSRSLPELAENLWGAFIGDRHHRRAALMLLHEAMSCGEHRAAVADLRRSAEAYLAAQLAELQAAGAVERDLDVGATARVLTSVAVGMLAHLAIDDVDLNSTYDVLHRCLAA